MVTDASSLQGVCHSDGQEWSVSVFAPAILHAGRSSLVCSWCHSRRADSFLLPPMAADGELYSGTSYNFLGSEPIISRNSSHSPLRTEYAIPWLNGKHCSGLARAPCPGMCSFILLGPRAARSQARSVPSREVASVLLRAPVQGWLVCSVPYQQSVY